MLRELWTNRTSTGETWAEALADRPVRDFYVERVGRGEVNVHGALHAELTRFVRGLTGRAAEFVASIVGHLPGERYESGGPRLQRVSLVLATALQELARQSVATSYF